MTSVAPVHTEADDCPGPAPRSRIRRLWTGLVAPHPPPAPDQGASRPAAPTQVLGDLGRAISARQLVLHYQPKVDVSTGTLRGVEALVRWRHPELGLLPPASFLPDAGRQGLMRLLTTDVLVTALDQVGRWRAVGGPRVVAVNLSASDVADPDLVHEVEVMLALRHLPGEALVLEVTEDVVRADPDGAAHVLHGLRSLGVGLSLDDCGAGPAGAVRLTDLPLTELKLDRSVVRDIDVDPGATAAAESAVQSAHCLGLPVVAEGVETTGALELLGAMDCDMAQGFLIGSPVPPELLVLGFGVPAQRTPHEAARH